MTPLPPRPLAYGPSRPPTEARCLACRAFAPLAELLRVTSVSGPRVEYVHRPGFGRGPEPCFRAVGPAAVLRIAPALLDEVQS